MTSSRGHGAACLKAAAVTGPARDAMNQTCAAHCQEKPGDCQPPPVCTDPMTGKTYSNTGILAETCPTQLIPQAKFFDWDDLFNNKGKPIPRFVIDDPFRLNPNRRPGSGFGDIGNFVVDGGSIHVKLNDAMPRDRFVAGKCAVRAATFNPVMYADLAPHTGSGRLALKTTQFISSSGFDACNIGNSGGRPSLVNLPARNAGSGGISLAYPSKSNDGGLKPKKIPRIGTVVPPRGSGGTYPSYYQPDKPPLTGRSPEDIAGGSTAGSTALGAVSGNQGYVGPQGGRRPPTAPCVTCGPKVSAKPTGTGSGGISKVYPSTSSDSKPGTSGGSGGISLTKPGGQAVPRPSPPVRSGPDPNIDYGGMAPRTPSYRDRVN